MAGAKEEFSDDEVFISVSNTDVSVLKPSVTESNCDCVSESNNKCDYRVTRAITKKEDEKEMKITTLIPREMKWLQKNSCMQIRRELENWSLTEQLSEMRLTSVRSKEWIPELRKTLVVMMTLMSHQAQD